MFILFLLACLASYLAMFSWIRRQSALDKARMCAQLARLEWPPEDAQAFIRQHGAHRRQIFQTLHYGAVIALGTCAAASFIA